ncbi:MAG TPA: hypothetical protein V6C89_16440 [Drouetiella sp.]|jgi:hypothetical protein
MLLDAEVKDDNYADMPRQQLQAQYAHPANSYLRSDASTGKNYIDLNAAVKSYSGAWLFGSENVECFVGNLKAQWQQWCPIPAGIADGVLMRGNVIYQNPGNTYRTSSDQFEGVIRTEHGERIFEGETQHTFYGKNFPGGSLKVVAKLSIPLTQRLAHNPMIVLPSRQNTAYNSGSNQRPVVASSYSNYQRYDQPVSQFQYSQPQYAQPQYAQPQNSQYQNLQPQYSPPQVSQTQYAPQQAPQPQYSQQQTAAQPASYQPRYAATYNDQKPDGGF